MCIQCLERIYLPEQVRNELDEYHKHRIVSMFIGIAVIIGTLLLLTKYHILY